MAEDVRALAAEVLRLGTAPPATMFEWSPGADFEGAARRLARAVLASPAVESAPAALRADLIDTKSLREWLSSWGDGPNWSDKTGATVPIAKSTLRQMLDNLDEWDRVFRNPELSPQEEAAIDAAVAVESAPAASEPGAPTVEELLAVIEEKDARIAELFGDLETEREWSEAEAAPAADAGIVARLRDLQRAWPKDPRYVNASPDEDYPRRILAAYIDETVASGSGGGEVLAAVMNEAQQERNAILRRAIDVLAEHAGRRGG